ncbi:MAG: glutamate synthase central domain-containing protein [Balneolaceae bacterium]|nr:glutamate synthase central domain-containing protein [Balneolaceae bacterium]
MTFQKTLTWRNPRSHHEAVVHRQKVFGYTYEDLDVNVGPMAENMLEPVERWETTRRWLCSSNQPQLLYNYFKQLFAQVTNPPIDPIREELITSTETMLGSQGNILDPNPESCRQIELKTPVLKNEELSALKKVDLEGFKSETLSILFKSGSGGEGLEKAMDELFESADKAIENGANILILSDRDFSRGMIPIPALLAVAGLHRHLIRTGAAYRGGHRAGIRRAAAKRTTSACCSVTGSKR